MSTSNDQMLSPNDQQTKEFSNVTADTRDRQNRYIGEPSVVVPDPAPPAVPGP